MPEWSPFRQFGARQRARTGHESPVTMHMGLLPAVCPRDCAFMAMAMRGRGPARCRSATYRAFWARLAAPAGRLIAHARGDGQTNGCFPRESAMREDWIAHAGGSPLREPPSPASMAQSAGPAIHRPSPLPAIRHPPTVYVDSKDFDRFVASVVATFRRHDVETGVFTVTPTPSSTMSQLILTRSARCLSSASRRPFPTRSGLSGPAISHRHDAAVRAARAAGPK